MKGIVFTEFLEMVEDEYGYGVVNHIIEASDLASDGIYTAIGTYHHSEIVQLLSNLSEKVGKEAEQLLQEFGNYLFETFLKSYPQFFEEHNSAFSFLESIDSHIHVEVLKLYPQATLPKFITEQNDEGQMTMIYQSERKMAALAQGLIVSSIDHYNEHCKIKKELISDDGTEVKFIITKV